MPKTLQQQQAERRDQIEGNRALGVQPWKNNEEQSDKVFEVEEGYHYLPREPGDRQKQRLGPGHRFHPTVSQVERGSLAGKARELTATEYAGLGRDDRKPMTSGADIGIRALPMADTTVKLALGAGLTEEDFVGLEPEFEGRYTRKQVQALIDARTEG